MESTTKTEPKCAHPESLEQIRNTTRETDRWAAYENHDLGHPNVGHLVFLVVGPTRTFKEAPEKAPDGPWGMGWRYLFAGWVNLETGEVVNGPRQIT